MVQRNCVCAVNHKYNVNVGVRTNQTGMAVRSGRRCSRCPGNAGACRATVVNQTWVVTCCSGVCGSGGYSVTLLNAAK